MAFELFTKRMVPLGHDPSVTIQRRGTMSLNKSAHNLLGSPAAVELLFDTEASIMGIRAVDETIEHAYTLRPMGGQRNENPTTYVISGIAFFNYYNIDTSQARRYKVELKDDVLCIDLKQEGLVVSSNREGKTKERAPGRSFGR